MSLQRGEVIAFLENSVREILRRDGNDMKIKEDTPLFGNNGALSSLMLVELMLTLEDFCSENGLDFVWANDSVMSQSRGAYRNIAALADFIMELPEAASAGE